MIVLAHCSIYLPEDLVRLIDSFLLWDLNSIRFVEHLKKNPTRNKMLQLINSSMSRKHGFYPNYQPDTEDEHWAFGNLECENVWFQAINCRVCGGYIVSHTSLTKITECGCLRDE